MKSASAVENGLYSIASSRALDASALASARSALVAVSGLAIAGSMFGLLFAVPNGAITGFGIWLVDSSLVFSIGLLGLLIKWPLDRLAPIAIGATAFFAAYLSARCSVNGSASGISATINGTPCAIRPEMKCTSRDSRSSFATAIWHALPCRRASASATASFGRRSSASLPLPDACSSNSATILKPEPWANRARAARWASIPRPDRPRSRVLIYYTKIGNKGLTHQLAQDA